MDRINNTKLHKMKKTLLLLRKYVTIFLIDFGILLRPQRKGVMIIEESEWHYPFFNCDFLRTIMSQVLAVLRSGYTPYIKLNNRKEDETNWDTFFAQPFNTSLNADECQKIGYLPSTFSYSYYFQTPFHKHHYKRWCKIFQKLVVLNERTKKYIDDEYARIIDPNMRILGVLCRGTDYIGYKGLPIQPKIEEVIKDCKVWMTTYNYEKIYLATESKEIYEQFITAFPEKIITNKRDYYDQKMRDEELKLIGEVHFNRANDNYLKGLHYLSSLVILSRCTAFIAGNCGGTLFSLLYNNRRFERFYIYNIGKY